MKEQGQKITKYKIGEIVRYTFYERDIVNGGKASLPKYVKLTKIDEDWGMIYFNGGDGGISRIKKTNFIEKIIWWVFW